MGQELMLRAVSKPYFSVGDDPQTFTEMLEFSRYWVWKPIRIQPYDCGGPL